MKTQVMDGKGVVRERPVGLVLSRTKVTKRSVPFYRQVPKHRHITRHEFVVWAGLLKAKPNPERSIYYPN